MRRYSALPSCTLRPGVNEEMRWVLQKVNPCCQSLDRGMLGRASVVRAQPEMTVGLLILQLDRMDHLGLAE